MNGLLSKLVSYHQYMQELLGAAALLFGKLQPIELVEHVTHQFEEIVAMSCGS